MSKRTDKVVGVTLAKYAWVYVEASSPKEAYDLIRDHLDDIDPNDLDEQFEDSDIEIDSYESYVSEVSDSMPLIWTPDGTMNGYEYREELDKGCEGQ